jgi:hypothetical protein
MNHHPSCTGRGAGKIWNSGMVDRNKSHFDIGAGLGFTGPCLPEVHYKLAFPDLNQ